jgi:hypothetical protein
LSAEPDLVASPAGFGFLAGLSEPAASLLGASAAIGAGVCAWSIPAAKNVTLAARMIGIEAFIRTSFETRLGFLPYHHEASKKMSAAIFVRVCRKGAFIPVAARRKRS